MAAFTTTRPVLRADAGPGAALALIRRAFSTVSWTG